MMGTISQMTCLMVFIMIVTAVAGCNDTTDPGHAHTTTQPPQTTSSILMTTLVGHDMTTQPPYSTNQPTTQPPYSTNQPTTQPPYSTNQPTTQPPYSTNQPTSQPPYSTNQPTTQPPYSTNQPTTEPPYSTNQPTTQPPYSTNQLTTQPPYSTNQPTTTSAPCENDTSLPEYGDEEPPSSNATTETPPTSEPPSSSTTTTGDEKCTDRGGVCSTAPVCEGGKYVTGLCAGPANRKCCIKDDPEPENFEFVTREEWNSTVDRDDLTFIKLPVTEVIIHHTEGQEGCNTERCKELVRNIQAGHKKDRGWVDIGYNFLICGDGKVYEGRGWDKEGAHTKGHNKISISIAFIGNFDKKQPAGAALLAAKALLEYGLANGKISPDYKVLGHRDVSDTSCPGDVLYQKVKDSQKPKAPGN